MSLLSPHPTHHGDRKIDCDHYCVKMSSRDFSLLRLSGKEKHVSALKKLKMVHL